MSDIAKPRTVVLETILGPSGKATQADRKAAFAEAEAPSAVRALIEKVRKNAYKIVDEDIAAAKAQGVTEDQLFELVVCAAIGQASRQYEGAMAALAEATEG